MTLDVTLLDLLIRFFLLQVGKLALFVLLNVVSVLVVKFTLAILTQVEVDLSLTFKGMLEVKVEFVKNALVLRESNRIRIVLECFIKERL